MSENSIRIAAPLDHADEVEPLLRAGAGEFYVGLIDSAWKKGGLDGTQANRRLAVASLTSLDALAKVVPKAHAGGATVHLAVNSPFYDESTWNAYQRTIGTAAQIGVDAFIVSDPSLMADVREAAPTAAIHLSTLGVAHNSEAVRFYQDLGVSRVILPRHLSLQQIAGITRSVPEMEYEAFLLNDGCYYVDGHCACYHRPVVPSFLPDALIPAAKVVARKLPAAVTAGLLRRKMSNPCVVGQRAITVEGRQGEAAAIEDHYRGSWNFDRFARRCGLCALKPLAQIGVSVVKVVGRGYPTEKKVRDVRAAQASLDRLAAGVGTSEFREACKDEFHKTNGFSCEERFCYYALEPLPIDAPLQVRQLAARM